MDFFDTKDLKNDEIFLSLIKTVEAIPERKYAPVYYFNICLNDGRKVGECNLKVDNSDFTKYCGNIGYVVDKKYRGNHYSLKAAKLLLKLAKKHNLEYVSITCSPDNIASNKICQALGAEFIETVEVPEYHEMREEYTKLNIYKIFI